MMQTTNDMAYVFPLSFAQQRLWFLQQLEPQSWAYNLAYAVRLDGPLDRPALAAGFAALAARHEALRTHVAVRDGQPAQVITPAASVPLPVVDLRNEPADVRQATARRLATAEARRPFDLAHGPLLRVRLLRLEAEAHVLLLTLHHLIADSWSLQILTRELATLYAAARAGQPATLPPLPIQYADYAVWQRRWLQGPELERQLAYWRRQLAGAPPVLALPTDRPRPARQSFRGAQYTFTVPTALAAQLTALGRPQGATLFMTLLAAFAALLARYTGQSDLCVGTDVANRPRRELEGLIGFFVNLLVLRVNLGGNPTFQEVLGRVREVVLAAYAHQELPFDQVVEALRPARRASHDPLVQVLCVLQNTPRAAPELPALRARLLDVEPGVARFDLALFLEETAAGLAGRWQYRTDLFDAGTVARLTKHFVALLHSVIAEPNVRLHNLDLLTAAEKEAQLMAEQQRNEINRQKFRRVQPKAVPLTPQPIVTTRLLEPECSLPLVLQPAVADVDVAGWARDNRDFIEAALRRHGALLFRDFPIRTVAEFEQVAAAICPELFGEYGDLPRESGGSKLYQSTPYPAEHAILFHNESSHLPRWPMKQWFFCVQAARQGGATPIVDCRVVYQRLRPELRERFQRQRLMYVRNFTPGFDVSWQEFFHTTDKSAVEESCRSAAIDFEWTGNDGLKTRRIGPAVAKHPQTGELLFFNQIQLHHVSCLEVTVRDSLLAMLGDASLPRNVYYGDGTPIDEGVVAEICQVYEQVAVRFPWREGDILMLDNMLVAHGRDPFAGPRKIVVAMGEMMGQEDIEY